VQDADQLAAADHGHAEERRDAHVDQDWIDHVCVIDPFDRDRLLPRRDRAGEAFSDRQPDSLAHLLLQTTRRGRDEFRAARVHQQDRRRVGLQQVADPFQQLGEQVLQAESRQRRVGDNLEVAQLL
jgi:hypothetical protein